MCEVCIHLCPCKYGVERSRLSTVSLARSVRSNANFHLDIIYNHPGDEVLDASSVGGYHNYVEVCKLPAVGGTIPWMEFWNL